MTSVYLGGPMKGLSFFEAQLWRDIVATALGLRSIECFTPLRGKEQILKDLPVIDEKHVHIDHPLTLPFGVVTRDFQDVLNCDLLFVNYIGAVEVSQGTVSEVAWAYAFRKRIVVAIEGPQNVHWHHMLRGQTPFLFPTLEEAIKQTINILIP